MGFVLEVFNVCMLYTVQTQTLTFDDGILYLVSVSYTCVL